MFLVERFAQTFWYHAPFTRQRIHMESVALKNKGFIAGGGMVKVIMGLDETWMLFSSKNRSGKLHFMYGVKFLAAAGLSRALGGASKRSEAVLRCLPWPYLSSSAIFIIKLLSPSCRSADFTFGIVSVILCWLIYKAKGCKSLYRKKEGKM